MNIANFPPPFTGEAIERSEIGGSGRPLSQSASRPDSSPARGGANAEALRVAQEFESIFIAEMLAPMFEGLDTDGIGGGGAGEAMFRPMLIEHYAAALAKSGGIGLADSVVRELTRLQASQEAADGADR